MGHWATGLSSNDTYQDVYETFFEYYNNDWEINKIKDQLKSDFKETIEIAEDVDSFWFALATALWECDALDSETLSKIDCDHDLKVWEELGASEQDLKKRRAVLDKFVAKISSPRGKAKKRKKVRIKVVKPIFEKGDCLIYKLRSGKYGGVFVFEAEQEGENGYNFIAATTINKSEKPTVKDFEGADILTIWDKEIYGKIQQVLTREEFIAYWFTAKSFKDFVDKFEKVGTLEVKKSFGHTFLGRFRVWIPWDVLVVFSELTFERTLAGQKQKRIVSVNDWRK
jgi:hypothetical protein